MGCLKTRGEGGGSSGSPEPPLDPSLGTAKEKKKHRLVSVLSFAISIGGGGTCPPSDTWGNPGYCKFKVHAIIILHYAALRIDRIRLWRDTIFTNFTIAD